MGISYYGKWLRRSRLLIQPQLLRRRSNPISLSRIISKHVETTRERPALRACFRQAPRVIGSA
jgi:hypothetical protein